MKKVLILASVASMIDQFNMPNIHLLQDMGYSVDVACNFILGNTCSDEKINELKQTLREMSVQSFQIDFARDISNIPSNLKALSQVKSLMKKNNYEFVHCHSPIGGVVGRLAGKITKTKVIYTAHGFHFYKGAPKRNWLIYYPIEKICSYMTDVLICINKEDYALAQKKLKANKVVYIPGIGVDLGKFSGCKVNPSEKRKQMDVPDNALWILSIGELIERKNHENLIRAVSKVDNVYLSIAGKGELDDTLGKLVIDLGAEDKVNLLGFRTDITELCEACDLFAFTSFQEGLPVALIEAMASGKPVMCSNIRESTDLIEEGVGGFLFNPSNTEELTAIIEKAKHIDLLQMGSFNLQKIKRFDFTEVINENEDSYTVLMLEGYYNFARIIKRWELRKSICVNAEDWLLFSVGEINANKNHAIVIRAIGELIEQGHTNMHYCIAGKGVLEAELVILAKQCGIIDRIHFLGFKTNVSDWYQAADVFVFPSFREGLPVSLMEAMASGLPCLVSNIRGNNDLITDEHMRFSPYDIDCLYNALEAITVDDIVRQQVKKNQVIIQTFSLENVLRRMKEIY